MRHRKAGDLLIGLLLLGVLQLAPGQGAQHVNEHLGSSATSDADALLSYVQKTVLPSSTPQDDRSTTESWMYLLESESTDKVKHLTSPSSAAVDVPGIPLTIKNEPSSRYSTTSLYKQHCVYLI